MSNLILLARLDALERSLERVEKQVEWARDHYKLVEEVWVTFYDGIAMPAIRCRERDLNTIRKQLHLAKQADDDAVKEEQVREAWRNYNDVYRDTESIFADCVEFLGGLALRVTELDEGICELADELMDHCEVFTGAAWASLTLPARQEPVRVPLTRMILLPFPEWTIWNLPLAAHQFGHLVADLKNEFRDWVNDQMRDPGDERHLYDLLADGLATYLMGPAYVCAAIRLNLNPLTVTDGYEHADDAKRAHVIFTMLNRMDEAEGDVARPYRGTIERLEDEWNTALKRAWPQGELEEAEKQQLETWVENMWKMFRYLRPSARYPCTGRNGWTVAQEWSKSLDQGKQIEPSGNDTLRDALNAAWLWRIQAPDTPDKVHKMEDIAEATLGLCQQITKERAKSKSKSKAAPRIGRPRQSRAKSGGK